MKPIFFKTIIFIIYFYLSNINSYAQLNFDFESSLQNWNQSGTAFKDQPEFGNSVRTYRVRQEISDSIGGDYWRGLPHSIGHHENYWVTSYKINKEDSIKANDSLGNLPTGTLTSDGFTISSDKIHFLIGGTGGRVELWIEREDNNNNIESPDNFNNDINLSENHYIVDSRVPLNEIEVMGREYFDTHYYINKKAKIRLIDSSATEHINVDDFYFNENDFDRITDYKFRTSYANDSNKYHKVNYFKERDINLPLWGFIDTHAHWMNNVGFGGDLVFGKPDGNIDTALKDCSDIHGSDGMGFGHFVFGKSFLIRFINEGVRKQGHITSGYPDFTGWPSFRSIIHQVMYVDWVRRAYEGGLRLLVCPMGNNLVLADLLRNFFDDNDYSDTVAVRKEVEYIKEMINKLRPEGWIDIAYNSEEAKRLMMENKLAVILGMEVDQPGGFLNLDSKHLANNKESINNFLNYIYDDLGIRHMFPVHHADNTFGGFSLYDSERFTINNYLLKDIKNITPYSLKYVVVDSSSLVSFRLGKEKGFFTKKNMAQLITGYDPPGKVDSYDGNYYGDQFKGKGHINNRGLTKNGKTLIELMIRRGMIIDIDHMSMNTTNDLLNLLDTTIVINETDTIHYNQYPLLAGHTNFLTQKFFDYQTSPDCEPCQIKIKDEHAKTDDMINKIKKSGGIVCPITGGDNDVQPAIFKFECPGSSKYFAEAYLYALEKMDNKNVGIGTDMNGFGDQLCPRFATFSSYALRGDLIRQKEIGNRRYLALNQDNGVKYENNLEDCRAHKFSGKDVFSKVEKNIWQAIFAAHSYRAIYLTKFQKKIVKGIRIALETKSKQDSTKKLDEVEAAGFILAKKFECNIKINIDSIIRINKLIKEILFEKINLIDSIYRSYSLLNGNNIPLIRCEIKTKNGIRDFDYNIDGLAHYGLLPDFLQDLKNIGLSNKQLTPLFNSAKDFTNLMEKCERIKEKLNNKDNLEK